MDGYDIFAPTGILMVILSMTGYLEGGEFSNTVIYVATAAIIIMMLTPFVRKMLSLNVIAKAPR